MIGLAFGARGTILKATVPVIPLAWVVFKKHGWLPVLLWSDDRRATCPSGDHIVIAGFPARLVVAGNAAACIKGAPRVCRPDLLIQFIFAVADTGATWYQQ